MGTSQTPVLIFVVSLLCGAAVLVLMSWGTDKPLVYITVVGIWIVWLVSVVGLILNVDCEKINKK